jgi:hypothetical protein
MIDDIELKNIKVKPVPAKVSLQLHEIKDDPPFDLVMLDHWFSNCILARGGGTPQVDPELY